MINNKDYEKEFRLSSNEYYDTFWDTMRNPSGYSEKIERKMRMSNTGSYELPSSTLSKLQEKLYEKSKLRKLATVVKNHSLESRIYIYESDDYIEWMKNYTIEFIKNPVIKDNFRRIEVSDFTLANLIRLGTDFTSDMNFDLEEFITTELAKKFIPFESKAFITGDGKTMPTGVLADADGGEIGVETEILTLDDVKKLYFSLDTKYRENGTWLMNDETALYLQTLKDSSGNYLWSDFDSFLMGKPVVIDNAMPLAQKGAKVIAFGDFSNYWIIERHSPTVRVLNELYALDGQIGYLSYEYLDGKLVRPDAIKVIKIKD